MGWRASRRSVRPACSTKISARLIEVRAAAAAMLTEGCTAGKSRTGPLGMRIAIGKEADLKGNNA